MSETQKAIIRSIVNYIVANGSCTMTDIKQDDVMLAAQMVSSFGSVDIVNATIISLSQFLLNAA